MLGLEGKRGPLKPPTSFRTRFIWILLLLPLGTAICSVVAVWVKGGTFLLNWLTYTPMMIALIFGPIVGNLLAGAIGYHWSYLVRRLIVFACMLALFGLFAFGANFLSPAAMLGSFVGVMLFVVFAAGYFARNLMTR